MPLSISNLQSHAEVREEFLGECLRDLALSHVASLDQREPEDSPLYLGRCKQELGSVSLIKVGSAVLVVILIARKMQLTR